MQILEKPIQIKEKHLPQCITKLQQFALITKEWIEKKYDYIIVISGGTGEGKSTLGIQLAKSVQRLYFRRFYFDNIVYNLRDLIEKISTSPPGTVIIIDEAVDLLFRRDAITSESKTLVKLLDKCRYKRLILIFILPNIWSLDKHVRDSRVRMWMWVPKRGQAVLVQRSEDPYITDPWYKKFNESKILKKKIINFRKLKGYLTTLHFPKLSPKEEIKYEAIQEGKETDKSLKFKEDERVKTLKQKDKENKETRIQNLIEREVKDEVIAETFGLTKGTITKRRKELGM